MWLWLKRRWRQDHALAAAVFALGSLLALAGGAWHHHDSEAQARAAFERRVERVTDEVLRRIRQPIFVLARWVGQSLLTPWKTSSARC